MHFINTNVAKLWKALNEEERKEYFFDIDALDWGKYFEDFAPQAKICFSKL